MTRMTTVPAMGFLGDVEVVDAFDNRQRFSRGIAIGSEGQGLGIVEDQAISIFGHDRQTLLLECVSGG